MKISSHWTRVGRKLGVMWVFPAPDLFFLDQIPFWNLRLKCSCCLQQTQRRPEGRLRTWGDVRVSTFLLKLLTFPRMVSNSLPIIGLWNNSFGLRVIRCREHQKKSIMSQPLSHGTMTRYESWYLVASQPPIGCPFTRTYAWLASWATEVFIRPRGFFRHTFLGNGNFVASFCSQRFLLTKGLHRFQIYPGFCKGRFKR